MLFLIRWFLLSCIRLLATPGQSVGCWNTRWNNPLWTSNPIFVCSKISFKSNWFIHSDHTLLWQSCTYALPSNVHEHIGRYGTRVEGWQQLFSRRIRSTQVCWRRGSRIGVNISIHASTIPECRCPNEFGIILNMLPVDLILSLLWKLCGSLAHIFCNKFVRYFLLLDLNRKHFFVHFVCNQ